MNQENISEKEDIYVILQASIHAEDISIFMVNPEKT